MNIKKREEIIGVMRDGFIVDDYRRIVEGLESVHYLGELTDADEITVDCKNNLHTLASLTTSHSAITLNLQNVGHSFRLALKHTEAYASGYVQGTTELCTITVQGDGLRWADANDSENLVSTKTWTVFFKYKTFLLEDTGVQDGDNRIFV